jgi:serine/threonine-protein kinase HipA
VSDHRIGVYADWSPDRDPAHLGLLDARAGRTGEIFEFAFSKSALDDPHLARQQLDPDISLFAGPQHPRNARRQFGMFADSSPDRWGRHLIDRSFARRKRTGELPTNARVRESDYLLGVHDAFRSGALRFKLDDAGAFLAADLPIAAPPFVRIRELEAASRALESDADDNPGLDEQLRILLAPGASLGGARPKASVSDPDGNLWIAKFPSVNDRHDTGAWEYVLHELASRCGICVPAAEARRFGGGAHTFLVRRFDRRKAGARIHFASAMTLTGHIDGESASYLEIAEVLTSQGAEAGNDLLELWRRIVFNIMVSNTDDHLRNHGFLLTPNGWRLSPAYDMNPNPDSLGLALDIDDNDNALDLDLARSVAPYFRVRDTEALRTITRLRETMAGWREIAAQLGITSGEQDTMAAAFQAAQ